MTAFLLLLAMAQFPFVDAEFEEDRPAKPVFGISKVIDMHFEYAVERSIMLEPNTTPPHMAAERLSKLGAQSWKQREAAGDFWLHNPQDHRWLFWGLRDPDWEIRLRSNGILRRLSWCRECSGDGACRFSPSPDPKATNQLCQWCKADAYEHGTDILNRPMRKCRLCDGQGRFWFRPVLE